MTKLCLGYSPWGNGSNTAPFNAIFEEKKDCFAEGFDGIHAFILWGGTDIHPSYYGQKHHTYSGAPLKPSTRDMWEWQAMKYCKAHGIPMIGVCRGAQFLCAFAGGALLQDVSGHGMTHSMTTNMGEVISTSSSHHQMLDVHGTNHELLAWSTARRSHYYYAEKSVTPAHIDVAKFREPEVVYFPDIGALAIQGHPEWVATDSVYAKYCLGLVQEYLFDEVWQA